MKETTSARTVHTYKELSEIAGTWPTVNIVNNYVKGEDHFCISYNGESVMYQNDCKVDVAIASSSFNGLRWVELMRFKPEDYN